MQISLGEIVEGKVSGIKNYGAFVVIGDNITAMVHISEISDNYVKDIANHLKVGDVVKVKIISINDNKISASIKQANSELNEVKPQKTQKASFAPPQNRQPDSFEEMMSRFMAVSEDRLNDLKKSTDSKQKGASKKRKQRF